MAFVAVLWIVHFIGLSTNLNLEYYGVFPREWSGIKGIFFSPLIHGSFEHLISNSIPLIVLMTILGYFYKKVAIPVFVIIYLLTGLAVWLFARRSIHIGASGVVYGLVSFVFWSGIFRRNLRSIVLALIVTILYSGYFAGVLPTKEGISWESHLFGALAGLMVAFLVKGIVEDDDKKENPWEGEEDEPQNYLLPRDVFEKTKAERYAEEQFKRNQETIWKSGGWNSDNT